MNRKRGIASVCALLATGAVAAGAVSAATGQAAAKSSGNQIVGSWKVAVNRPAPAPPLTSLQIFTGAGSVIENANEWSATRTDAFGTWERVAGRTYANTTVFFRFNPQTGAYLGMQKIDRTIQLSQDSQSFTIVARVSVLDPNGNTVATFPATGSGERMQVDRIPDQP